MLVIEPLGGLCNRMRTIRSAYSLSQEINKKLYVLWFKDDGINCGFHDLFNKIPNVKIIELTRLNRVTNRIVNIFQKKTKLLVQSDLYDGENQIFKLDDFKKVNNKKIYIRTYSDFLKSGNFDIFIPKDKLMNIVNYILKDSNTIGIHIRRTDNVESIKNSPMEAFIKIIEEEIKQNNPKFFLSTDNIEIQKSLHESYPNNIIYHNKEFSRQTKKGIQDALIDLLCLSKCKKIYGSYFSSFTDVAAEINNIEKVVVKGENIEDILSCI